MKSKCLYFIFVIIIVVISIIVLFQHNKLDKYNTVYTINVDNKKEQKDSQIVIGKQIPKGIKQYNTGDEVRNDFSNQLFYFKHVIKSGIVKESYIDFIINVDMVDTNPGMTLGVYEIKGYEKDYENNKEVLLKSFGKSYCEENNSYMHCVADGFYANVYQNGYIEVGKDFWICYITENGASRCDFGK